MVLIDESGRLVRVSDHGRVTARQLVLPAPALPRDLAGFDDDDVWLSVGNTVLRVDGRTLALEGAVTGPWRRPYEVTHDGNGLMVTDAESGILRRIPDSAQRIR